MKINQFAYVPKSQKAIIRELKDIKFIDANNQKISDPMTLFHDFLLKFCLQEKQSKTVGEHKLANLMATEKTDANSYTKKNGSVSKLAFYNIALQLLGFAVSLDFDLSDPLKAMKRMNLPIAKVNSYLDLDSVISAWYLLLNTRTKNGQTLIDYLAGQGYYQQFSNIKKPLFFNGKAQAVFDTADLIRDVVYVEAPEDNDDDGKRDLIKAEIIRPQETESGLKVPTLFTASPYDQGTNEPQTEKITHKVDHATLLHKKAYKIGYQDIEASPATHPYDDSQIPVARTVLGQTKEAEETFSKNWTYALNDYFLARGFAVVYSSGVGSKDSDGFCTTGSKAEVVSATAVIQWLHNDRVAFTNKKDDVQINAWWCNGNIGMTGRSYLATLASACALTGVNGLKTCVVEAGISNWYDYYRENGLVVAPGGFQGEDADVLAEETFSREQNAGDYHNIKEEWQKRLKQLYVDEDRQTGNYNKFWDARNYLKDNSRIKADMFIVHGLNDWNVKLINAYNLRNILKSTDIKQKLVLHQGQHEYLNNFRSVDFTDQVNLWLSNKLYDVDNKAQTILPDVLVQDNAEEQTWHTAKDWNGQEVKQISLNDKIWHNLGKNNSFNNHLPQKDFKAYVKDQNQWDKDLLTTTGSKMDKHCIRLISSKLDQDVTINGQIQLNLKVASDKNIGLISAALVDYGKTKRLKLVPSVLEKDGIITGYNWRKDDLKEFEYEEKPSLFKKITDGHINLQNRNFSYQVDKLKPNKMVNVTLKLQPEFFRVLKGHKLGLILFSTDMLFTIQDNQKINYKLNLAKSSIEIPIK